MSKPSFYRSLLIALALAGLGISAYVAATARFLRPLADDYCWAGVAAQDGIAGAIGTWFNTWTGDLTAIATNTVIVGVPLLYASWGSASAIPFVLGATAAIGLAIGCIWLTGQRLRPWAWIVVAALLGVGWWAYWWIPAWLGSGEQFGLAGQYVTFWQNINSGYVVLSACGVFAWLALSARADAWRPSVALAVWLVVGLAIGLGGYPLALTLAAATAVAYCARLIRRSVPLWSSATAGRLTFLLAIAAAAVVSLRSPGAQIRAAQIDAQPSPADILTSAGPHAISQWFAGVANFGSLAVVVLLTSAGWMLVRSGTSVRPIPVLRQGVGVIALSVLLAVASGAAEPFAYAAPWHFVGSYALSWVGLAVVAFGMGGHLAVIAKHLPWGVPVGAAIALLVLSGFAVVHVGGEIEARYAKWNEGPAPIAGVMDIYTPAYYTTSCWYQIGQVRKLPFRPFALPRVGAPPE